MKKRTYGTGSSRELSEGKYELRYKGKSKTVEAATKKQADRLLSKWIDEQDEAAKSGPAVSMDHLFDLHLADLRRKKRKSLSTAKLRLDKHLREPFGALDATMIRKRDITSYIDARLAAGAEPATINRELAILRRSFILGVGDELIAKRPVIETLPEDNARQGFVEDDVYRAMLLELPEHVRMPWCFGYYTGMRRGELLLLQWQWMDWTRMVIVIPELITKNKKRRYIPVYADMVDFLRFAWQARDPDCPYIFQRDGKRIRSIRKAIELAAARIGKPELLFHDLRRTGVRNMERAGIPRTIAKQVSGHLTEAVYLRYAIGAEKDALEVGSRMEAFHRQERATSLASEKLWDKLWDEDSKEGADPAPGKTDKLM